MKPSPTDINPLPHRYRNLVALTGLTHAHAHTIYLLVRQRLPPCPARPCGLPLWATVLLVLVHLRTNLTTRALAALPGTSQSAVDPIIITWCRCWPAYCDPPRTTATTRGSSTAP
ncbi:hypothetical protein [Mycobacterium sp.]|uniref:hypothetical protein n=1 Tax=Mycobacterium sp. TaxID=1785 RepID=UPI003342AC9A